MKYVFYILLLSMICACSTSQVEIENTDLLTWERIADIPQEYARINSSVIVDNSVAYLMTGKGAGRFSSAPEIVSYSDQIGWKKVGTYQGAASSGNSAFWQTNDKIMVVGGVNSSNAPFDQITMMSIDGSDFTLLDEVFPKGPIRASSHTQIGSKGYLTYATQGNFQSPSITGIISFNTETKEWADISTPNTLSTNVVSTPTTLFLFDHENLNSNFFSYSEQDDNWIPLADFPGPLRRGFSMVATDEAIYIGFGADNSTVFSDLWKYDIQTNEWERFIEYPGEGFHSGIGFCNDDKLFFGSGSTTVTIGENGVPLNTSIYSIKLK